MKVWATLRGSGRKVYHERNALGYPQCHVQAELEAIEVRNWKGLSGTTLVVSVDRVDGVGRPYYIGQCRNCLHVLQHPPGARPGKEIS